MRVLALGVVDLAAVAAGAGLALGLLGRVAPDVLDALVERSGAADPIAAALASSALDARLLAAALVGHGNHQLSCRRGFPRFLPEASVDVGSRDIIDVRARTVNRKHVISSLA